MDVKNHQEDLTAAELYKMKRQLGHPIKFRAKQQNHQA